MAIGPISIAVIPIVAISAAAIFATTPCSSRSRRFAKHRNHRRNPHRNNRRRDRTAGMIGTATAILPAITIVRHKTPAAMPGFFLVTI